MKDYLHQQLQRVPPHLALLRAVECRLMGQVPLTPPILDVGCGDGAFASLAYDQLPLHVGLDAGAPALHEARQRRGVYRHVVRSSAEALPFGDATFHTVVSNCVIEHVPDVDAALREICRVLSGPDPETGRPGGLFATTVPSERFAEFLLGTTLLHRVGLDALAASYGRFFNRISRHYHVYPARHWQQKFEQAGLQLEQQTDYFSQAAHHRFDLCHYLGVPTLVSKAWLGTWTALPFQAELFERWLRRYYNEPYPEVGAYRFFVCRKLRR